MQQNESHTSETQKGLIIPISKDFLTHATCYVLKETALYDDFIL